MDNGPPKCAICKKEFKGKESTTIDRAWIDAGGFGQVPLTAIVHVKCDKRDHMRKVRANERSKAKDPRPTEPS